MNIADGVLINNLCNDNKFDNQRIVWNRKSQNLETNKTIDLWILKYLMKGKFQHNYNFP